MKRVRLVISVSIILVVLILWASSQAFVLVDDDYQKEDLLRLHIVPNSNSIADQVLKREIKEQITTMTQNLLKEETDVSQAQEKLVNNQAELTGLIEENIQAKGYDYQVDLNITELFFPTRTYGNLTLDEGNYKALEITIGQGDGENWWCVLFPPLCFIDSTKSNEKEFNNSGDDELDFEFKLKSVEYLEENHQWVKDRLSSINLANILSADN
ncbi:stage II sporulation protein R [Natroniella sulfidigena]|uniref:stage II sporulation protein R n=1 Tax=Natroniella sulfidigena TaxID=723921 RepID=UPI00200AB697|nr:stage II sporulation protein R [Natroniella sulfidigena]MCK8816700.1 stage II sporulation protein R [Natroniella sulfidigena]